MVKCYDCGVCGYDYQVVVRFFEKEGCVWLCLDCKEKRQTQKKAELEINKNG